MPGWLEKAFVTQSDLSLGIVVVRLLIAFALGFAVAFIYWATHRRDETFAPSFLATLVLLSILIAMVTQVIGDNLARAFGLVGALSIVRFRTVVEDTRDTAFVIFAVILGMAAGAGHVLVAFVGLPIVAAAAAILRPRFSPAKTSYWTLTLRVGLNQPPSVAAELMKEHFDELQLIASSTARQGAALETIYRVRPKNPVEADKVVAELNRLEGVQSVELRQ